MPIHDHDAGLHLLNEVTKWAEAHKVPIVPGDVASLTMTSVDLELDEDGDLGAQLVALLNRTDPYLLVLARMDLTAGRIDETLEALAERDDAADELAAARACRRFVGNLAWLDIVVFVKAGPVAL